MRRITQLTLAAFGFVIIFMSCSKSSDSVPNTPAIQMSGLINGGNWTTTLANAYIFYDTANHTDKLIFGGTTMIDTFTESISVSVDSFNGIGIYSIKKTGAVQAYYWLHSKYYTATSGQVIVESYSTKLVKGYYNFKTDSVTVTEGNFNLHVQ